MMKIRGCTGRIQSVQLLNHLNMLLLAALLCTVILGLLAYLDMKKPKNFPPGPKWYPIVGSAPQVQKARSKTGLLLEATAEMCKKYGPVLGLKVGKDPIIVVYGPQEIKEFLMSDDLIGRPRGPFYEMRTWGLKRGILCTDEEFWHEQKRYLVRHLREFGFGTKNMTILIEEEVAHLINFIEKSINNGSGIFNMESLFGVSILNTIWKMIAGVRYDPEDKMMKRLQKLLNDLFKAIHMVGAAFSHFPVLKYIAPEMSGYKCYVDTHVQIWNFLQKELDLHKKTHDPEEPRDLMDVYLTTLKSPDHGETFSEQQLVALCMDMFMAGSETTNNSLSFGFLNLILHPRVQRKAQEEIDRVLGDRMPSLDDRPNMPYMECVVLEALRMFGARAFTVPHRALRDTHIGGYFVPKDILVTANLHGCLMGPDSGYENPLEFRPERHLKDGKISLSDNYLPFGQGRRRCMGETLARANVFLFTTAVLQKFNFHIVPESPPEVKVQEGVTPSPFPFKARVTARVF